jgi:hypothetical protein
MKRRQVLQAIPALTAAALLPSVAHSAESLPLPPSLVMKDLRRFSTGAFYLEAYWHPYGDDQYHWSSEHLRVFPALWWPLSVPYWGPSSIDGYVRDFKERIARNYQESRLFYEKYGMGWSQASRAGFRPEPEFYENCILREWRKIKGEWTLGWSYATERNSFSAEERELLSRTEQAWMDSGKTEEEAYPWWRADGGPVPAWVNWAPKT